MKKLMTMIGVAALAFGLHADDFVFNQTDFKDMPVGPFNVNMDDKGGEQGTLYWAGDAGDSEIKAVSEADDSPKFLAIDNSAPLFRTVNGQTADPQEIGTGVFADMHVKFTASDAADPVVLADGSKLGIWVAADEEAETPTTNLMVRAASLVNGEETPVAADFTVAVADDFDFTAEHRITIRAIEEISAAKLGMAGFVLYVDGAVVAAADEDYVDKIGFDAFNSVAAPFYAKKQLFVSLVKAGTDAAQTIFGVGFKGTGELADVALADAEHAPEFAKPAVDVTIAWGAGVTGFTYQGVATNVSEAGSVVVTLASPSVPVTLSGVTISDDYVDGGIKAEGLDKVEDGVWAFVEAPASLTMKTAPVAFTIGDKKYATFEDALADAEDGDIIKLAKSCVWEGEVAIDVGEGNEIVLDLAGETISANDYDDYDLFVVNNGKLTIIDSVGGGKIAVTGAEESLYAGIIYCDGGKAQIGLDSDDADKGVVVDALVGEAGALTILKGLFIASENEKEDLENYLLDETYEVADAGDYWKVQAKQAEPELPTATVKSIEEEDYAVAVQFDADDQGDGYDDWQAKFILTSDVAIGADEIALGGSYEAWLEGAWIDIPFAGCEANEPVSIAGDLEVTVDDLFTFVQTFKCGVKNLALKNDATFSLALVIVNPDDDTDVEELCSIDNLTVAKKEEAVKPGEPVGLGNGGDFESEEEAQAAAEKLPIVIEQADIDAGLTVDAVMVKAEFIGGAWMAVLEPKTAPIVDETMAISVDEDTFSATVQNPVPGVYYGFVATDTLGTAFKPVGEYIRAKEGDVKIGLDAPKGGDACFYKLNAALRPPKVD